MKIYIVEDDLLLLQMLQILLGGEKNMEITGTATCAEDALTEIKTKDVDIVITDLGLPKMQGVQFIGMLKTQYPNLQVIANTICEDNETVFDAIRAGACGYLLKGSTPRELIEAINELCNGGAPMSPKIARKVILEMQNQTINEQYILSHREKEVLKLIEKGYSYEECAKNLSVSKHTVNSHIKNTYKKLQAKNRAEAIITARQKGLI